MPLQLLHAHRRRPRPVASHPPSLAAATFFALILSLAPSVAEGFAPPRNCNPAASALRSSSSSSALHVASATQAEKEGDQEQEQQQQRPWWKDFRLRDAALAESVREDFPILSTMFDEDGNVVSDDDNDNVEGSDAKEKKKRKRLIYLDSAATSQKPRRVIEAVNRYYETSNSNVHRGAHALSRAATDQYEGARDAIAKLVNAEDRNEVVFTSGASEAINLIANSYSCTCGKAPDDPNQPYLTEGDEILLSEMEHHSNIVPWQMAADRSGAKLKYVPAKMPDGAEFDLDAFRELVTPKTKMVALQHVSNVLGSLHPADDIVSIVRKQAHPDCRILLDACQSVPHGIVDVQALGVDYLAASGHKMCGPTGIGFLWGKEDLLNSLPPYRGGGEMIDQVYMDHSTYANSPARFEAGTPPIAQAVGLGAAIEYLNDIGMERIANYEKELGDYLRRRLDDVPGVRTFGPPAGVERAALCSFACDAVHPSDLSSFLDVEGVAIRAGHHCCQPLHRALGVSHSARASLYFYNTQEDVDEFVQVLEETLQFFGDLESSVGPAAVGGGEGDGEGDVAGFVPLF